MTTPQAGSRGSVSAATRALPPRPNLEYLKNEAKRRLDAARPTNRRLKLADVQFQLAREYGFASWRDLKARIEQDPGAGGPDPVGDWVATFGMSVPAALHIRRADTGRLKATFDVPSQGHYDDPVEDLVADGVRLAFAITVRGVNALYEAAWDEAAGGWAGTWTQNGVGLPLTFARGTLPAAPVVEGLDGLWDGILPAKPPVRLTFRIRTGERGTLTELESSRQEGQWHPARAVIRAGDDIELRMLTLSVRGRLSDDGGRIDGQWTRDGTTLPLTLVRRAPGAAAPRATTPPEIDLPVEALAEYAGLYGPADGAKIRLAVEDGRLWTMNLAGVRGLELAPCGPDAFFFRQVDNMLTFERDEAGAVTAMVLSSASQTRRVPRVG